MILMMKMFLFLSNHLYFNQITFGFSMIFFFEPDIFLHAFVYCIIYLVCPLYVAVPYPVLQTSDPPSLRDLAVWGSWHREDSAGRGRGQREWNELHQHQGGLIIDSDKQIEDHVSLYYSNMCRQ